MAKAFRGLDVHRTGRLPAHEFELRLTQVLSLDVELSGHIYSLLHLMLHGDSTGCVSSDAKPEADTASSGPKSPTPSSTRSARMDSSRSIEEGMINEEEFANFFEGKKA